jgi:putative SOS response-associated peptidase YedK
MCGRFALGVPRRLVAEAMGVPDLPDAPARYNIAPAQLIEAVFVARTTTRRRAGLFRWGLVAPFAKTAKATHGMINARSETVLDKPSFRAAIRYRRCLVPAQGFYEWQRLPGGGRQPYFLALAEAPVMALAGIFETGNSTDGEGWDTAAILTRAATGVMAAIHDRMPLIVPPERFADWLDPGRTERTDIEALLALPPPQLKATPVGPLVNNPRRDDPACLRPVETPLLL